jgi:CheY-like chemotaxis protein
VDDNDDDIALVRIAVARVSTSCVVWAATTGDEAIRQLGKACPLPDVVLLDWKMPGTSGAEVLEAVRAIPRLRCLPVLVFTSSDDPNDVRTAYDRGATCYVPKPLDMAGYLTLARDLHAFWGHHVIFPRYC